MPARDGATWAAEFARSPALKSVVREDGTGWGQGLRWERARRRAARQGDLEDTLDVFHTLRAGARALRATWAGATRVLERAEAAQPPGDRRGRQGPSRAGSATQARRPWRRAERLWDQAVAAEMAWARVRAAFECFTPEGRRNDRHHAAAVVAAALPSRTGPTWAKARRLLPRPESFPFLDQARRRWDGRGREPEVLSAVLDLEGLRRQPRRLAGATPEAAATRAWALARTVPLAQTRPEGPEQAQRVRGVLRGVWRARSLVECVNSVVRMQPARHRKLSQGLLDLKRLYGNLRRFRTGRRKDQTPYGLLGLKLPDLSFWEFLKLTPGQLRQELSAPEHAP